MRGVESVAGAQGAEHAILLAAVGDTRGARHAERCLARVAGEAGERCRARLRELAALAPGARRAALAALARELQSLPPRALERVHPEWIQALVDTLPSGLAALLRGSWSRHDPSLRWPESAPAPLPAALQAQLPHLLAQALAPPEPRELHALRGWPSARVIRALRGLGYLVLAALLRNAPALRDALDARLAASERALLERALSEEPIALPRHLRATAADDLPLELALQWLEAAPASLRARLARALPRAPGGRLLDAGGAGELAPCLEALLRGERLLRDREGP